MTKVYGVFSEEFFPSSYGGQQRAMRPRKTQSPATGPQPATLILKLHDSAHPEGTQSINGDRDSLCTFKRIIQLLTFRRDVLLSSAHNSSSFEGQFFVCYWIVRAELLAIGKPITMYPETFIHHKLCIASSSLQWVEATLQQKVIVCLIFWSRPRRQKRITWKRDLNAYGLHCSWAPFSL